MHRKPYRELSQAQRRLGPLHALVFLLLVCCLWSWSQAQATPGAAASGQLASASFVTEAELVALPLACVNAVVANHSGVDLVVNEIADQEALASLHLRTAPPQTVPPRSRQPALQQAERQPLLRPPTRLG